MLARVVDHVRPEIMREARARADREARDHGENCGERHRTDEREEQLAAKRLGSSGAAMLSFGLPPTTMCSGVRIVAAPKPRNVVMM